METASDISVRSSIEEGEIIGFLKSFVESGSAGAKYLEDHIRRYLETVRLVPPGGGGRLLELGAAFHHLTPAFAKFWGCTEIVCNDLWAGEKRTVRTLRALDGSYSLEVPVDNFDVEKDAYPYPDASFDTVVCCEILEHMSSDPMHMLMEVNRILKPGGHLLLTTPNLASAKSLSLLLKGDSPYLWGPYPVGGIPTDRHNREYTALEVKTILQLAGFAVETLKTNVSWWPVDEPVMELLGKLGLDTTLRGDNTLALARRVGPVQNRYPQEFYCEGEFGRSTQEGSGRAVPTPQTTVPATDTAPHVTETTPVRPLKILVVNNIVPNHDRGGSCYRMMTLLRLLIEDGHTIEYLGRDAKGMDRYVHDLEELGIKVHATDPERLRPWDDVPGPTMDVPGIIQSGGFDLAILLLWFWSSPTIPEQYLNEIRRHSPKTRILVLSDDVHWLHDTRLGAVTGRRSDYERGLGYRPRELEIYLRADMVAAITQDDAARIRAEDPTLRVEIMPHVVMPREGTPPGFDPRRGIVTVGAFGYYANVDAALWFAREVFPIVKETLPGVHFRIVGNNPPAAVRELACEDIDVTGWVPDVITELDRCRVFVSAIRYGTGLKTKNIQAMGAGIPLVGTTISLEGSGARNGIEARIEDDPRAFAEAVVRLYTDETAWKKQVAAGRELAVASFGKDAVRAAIRLTLARVDALPASRARDASAWSICAVERRNPDIMNAPTSSKRFSARLCAHLATVSEKMKEGRPEEAIEELRRVLAHCGQGAFEQNPTFFAGIMCRFGDAYRAAGRIEEALACYHEALGLTPDEDDAIFALREMAAAGGSISSARTPQQPRQDRGVPDLDATRAGDSRAQSGSGLQEGTETRKRESTRSDDATSTLAASPAEARQADAASAPAGSSGMPSASTQSTTANTGTGSRTVGTPTTQRPRPVPIEGRRSFALLCPALDGNHWQEPLAAYFAAFTSRDDVSLLLLGPTDRLEHALFSWLREHAIDETLIPDVVIVPAPGDPGEFPRFVAAADALLVPADSPDAGLDSSRSGGENPGAGARNPGRRSHGAPNDPAWRVHSIVELREEAFHQGIPVLIAGRDELRTFIPEPVGT